MKEEKRNVLINRLENEIDQQIDLVVDQFQNRSNAELNKPAKNGGWSIAQNLEHLNLYFDYYNPVIKNVLEESKQDTSAAVFKSGWMGRYFTQSMDYRKGNKIKAFKDYVPPSQLDGPKVIQQFIENEETFLQLIREAKHYNLSHIKVAISLTKWIKMRLGDVFQFVTRHNERHLMQALRTLEPEISPQYEEQ